MRVVTAAVARRTFFDLVDTAFLDSAAPDLESSVSSLVARGASRVVIVPFFLTLGTHMRRDLPQMVDRLRSAHPGVAIEVSDPLEGHPALVDIVAERALQRAHATR